MQHILKIITTFADKNYKRWYVFLGLYPSFLHYSFYKYVEGIYMKII